MLSLKCYPWPYKVTRHITLQTHVRNEINFTQRYYYTVAVTNKSRVLFSPHLAAQQKGTQPSKILHVDLLDMMRVRWLQSNVHSRIAKRMPVIFREDAVLCMSFTQVRQGPELTSFLQNIHVFGIRPNDHKTTLE